MFKATGLRIQTLRHNNRRTRPYWINVQINRLTNKQINPWWQLGYKQTASASASGRWFANVNGWRWGSQRTVSIQGQLEERWTMACLSLRNVLWDMRGGCRQWQRSRLTEEAVMKAVLDYPSDHEVCLWDWFLLHLSSLNMFQTHGYNCRMHLKLFDLTPWYTYMKVKVFFFLQIPPSVWSPCRGVLHKDMKTWREHVKSWAESQMGQVKVNIWTQPGQSGWNVSTAVPQ